MTALQQMYQQVILDHAKRPYGRGLAPVFDGQAHHVNPTCGDEITVRVSLDGDLVSGVSHDGLGCSISQASASVMSELLTGRSVADSLRLQDQFQGMVQGRVRGAADAAEDVLGDAVAFAGVARYPMRVKCALLAWMAWKDATARAVDATTKERA